MLGGQNSFCQGGAGTLSRQPHTIKPVSALQESSGPLSASATNMAMYIESGDGNRLPFGDCFQKSRLLVGYPSKSGTQCDVLGHVMLCCCWTTSVHVCFNANQGADALLTLCQ
jgi:hypothetical protein